MAKLTILLFGSFILFSCTNNNNQETSSSVEQPLELPENFIDFYESFHTDSAFQMAHIVFPLEGIPNLLDSTIQYTPDFRWQAKDWILHRPFNPEQDGYRRNFQFFGEDVIIERVFSEESGFGLTRRWAFLANEWYLIYYEALNPIGLTG